MVVGLAGLSIGFFFVFVIHFHRQALCLAARMLIFPDGRARLCKATLTQAFQQRRTLFACLGKTTTLIYQKNSVVV